MNEQLAEKIKQEYVVDSSTGYRTLAKKYGVSWKVIYNIVNRGTYRPELEERFWSKVLKQGSEECWEWLASKSKLGYGQIGFNGKVTEAHRVAYLLTHGEIPEGLHVRHKCDNRACCNPSHLELGNHQDNMNDMASRGRAKKQSKRKLTKEQANSVLSDRQSGMTLRALAKKYSVSKGVIDGIVYGWRYVD